MLSDVKKLYVRVLVAYYVLFVTYIYIMFNIISEFPNRTIDRVVFKCIKSKANIEIYMGEKKITSLILE